MAYTPTEWKNREVENPRTFQLQNNPNGTTTLIPKEGNVIETGTPIIAENMNKIEQGIKEAHDGIGNMPQELATHKAEKASKAAYGHVKVGAGINVSDGVISVAEMTASNVTTTGGSNVQAELNDLKSSVSSGKSSVKNAITGKGGTVLGGNPPTFAQLAAGVYTIPVVTVEVGDLVVGDGGYGGTTNKQYTEILALQWGGANGRIRVDFTFRPTTTFKSYVQIWVNGVPVGIERMRASVDGMRFIEDIDIKAGDRISLYGYKENLAPTSHETWISDFKVCIKPIVLATKI